MPPSPIVNKIDIIPIVIVGLFTNFIEGIIADEKQWIKMMENRNRTSHTYDEEIALEIYKNIKSAIGSTASDLPSRSKTRPLREGLPPVFADRRAPYAFLCLTPTPTPSSVSIDRCLSTQRCISRGDKPSLALQRFSGVTKAPALFVLVCDF